MTRRVLLALLTLALLAPTTAATAAPQGALSELSGAGGCATPDGSSDAGPATCLADAALDPVANQDSTTVAPDGRFVYVADENGRIVMYARDGATGLLSIPVGTRCWDDIGDAGCADYRGAISGDGDALAISGDGRTVYAAGGGGATPGLLVFSRDLATGVLTQLAGTAGCLTADGAGEAGAGTCADIRAVSSPNAIRMSADDRLVYVTDYGAYGSVLTFSRDAATGALTQLPGTDGCITKTGASEDGPATCQDGRLTSDDRNIAITPDGRHAFVADFNRSGVEVFDRDPATGVLTARTDQASCITQTGSGESAPGQCLDGRGLGSAYQVATGADGRTLYVSGENLSTSGVAVLRLDPATGALSQPAGTDGCATLAGADGDSGTTCAAVPSAAHTYAMVLGPDGRTLYALNRSSDGRVGVLHIDPSTGLIAPLPGTAACVSGDGKDAALTAGACVDARAMVGPYSIAFDPEGANAYVADDHRHSVTAFRREAVPVCTSVTASTPFQTPLALTLSCRDPNGDAITRQISSGPSGGAFGAIGASGAATFTPAAGFSGAATFAYTATDATGTSEPATGSVTVGAAPAQPAATDRTKPTVRVTKARLTAKGVALTLSLSEAAQIRGTLKGRLGKGRKAKTIASGSAKAARAGTVTLLLKPAKASRKALLGLRGKRLKAFRGALSVTATDAAGNRGALSAKALKLKR